MTDDQQGSRSTPQSPDASVARRLVRSATSASGADLDTAITSLSGSISGFVATFAKQPIQRVKWIRQVHEGPPVPYKHIVRETMSKSGGRGFFAGSLASVYRNVPHSMLAYTVYPKAEAKVLALQQQLTVSSGATVDETRSFSTRFYAGYATLLFTTAITHPLDTLRVRLSVHSEAAKDGWLVTSGAILKGEGAGAFYRGFGATLVGAGPRGALGFGVFETLKPAVAAVPFFEANISAGRFACGFAAGVVSEFFVYPLDTIRRRQQALGDASSIGKRNLARALEHVYRTEGVRGMFKGISLNLVKNPLATAVSFLVNDLVKDALGYGESLDEGARSAG